MLQGGTDDLYRTPSTVYRENYPYLYYYKDVQQLDGYYAMDAPGA